MKELLLLLCCYPFEEKNREYLSKLIREVKDWRKTVELINDHGIIALAAYNIKQAGLEKEIPGSAMAILENGQRQSMVRNLWLTERWKEVNAILCNAGIKHVLLKGMALEYTLYGANGLRQMNDNDILVKREDSLKAWHLLQKAGFSFNMIKSPIHKKMLTDIGKHLPTLYKEGYEVEIHHRLFDKDLSSNHSYDDLIDNAFEISVDNTKALVLSKEIQLKYLIDHFERHCQEGSGQVSHYGDILLLDKTAKTKLPDSFFSNPKQENELRFRKAAYKIAIRSVPAKFRLPYITGDIFPSLKWMKKRYGCSGLRAVFYYPQRIGKLGWLV